MGKIVGIGVDCVEISRFEGLTKSFVSKVFTEKEAEYCRSRKSRAQHFAGRFAAKEAIIKAMDGAGKRVAMHDIEVLNSESGAPNAKILSKGFSRYDIHLSISHSRNVATAFSIVTEKK